MVEGGRTNYPKILKFKIIDAVPQNIHLMTSANRNNEPIDRRIYVILYHYFVI